MIRKLVVAVLVMLGVGALAHWTDRLHLLAGGLAVASLIFLGLIIGALRRRNNPEELDGYISDADVEHETSVLRDGLAGLVAGGAGLALAALIYAYALPPFYPFLVGDCPQLVPRLDIYEEARAWPRAVELIDKRISQPLDKNCRAELTERKCRYLIEWSKTLPREQAELKLQEAERWAEANQLPNYRTIAKLMREQLQPTPSPPAPVMVTPTPTPAPTPRSLPGGATAQIAGLDLTYFPPTIFAYLRVVDAAGNPIKDLAGSDVRILDDGRPVGGYTLAHFSQAPAPICAALVIDYSGSMEGAPLTAAKAGARAFLGLLGPKDQVEVIGFNDKPQLLHGWSTDRQAAIQALDTLPAKDRTALWDALWLAGSDLAGSSGRKVVVVLTDGADNRSQHTKEQVIEQARRTGLSVFVIGLRSSEYDGAALQSLVQAVGGRYAEANNPGELEEYYRQTAGAIRNEYRLAITLSRRPDGGAHHLRIEVGGPQPLVAEQSYQDPAQ